MIKSLKKKSVLIQTIIYSGVLILLLITFLVLQLSFNVEISITVDYLLFGIGVVCLLIGYVASDLAKNKHRRKTKNWAGKLPDELIERLWEIRTPWFIAFVTAIITTIAYYIAVAQ